MNPDQVRDIKKQNHVHIAATVAVGFAAVWGTLFGKPLLTSFMPETANGVIATNLIYGGAALAFCFGLGALVNFALITMVKQTSYEPIWSPLDDSQISKGFMGYVAANSTPAIKAGYIPLGTYLAKEMRGIRIESACLLHPHGHCLIQITQAGPTIAVEIQSFLDDGSVIESCNINAQSQPELLRRFSMTAKHGFLVSLYPSATAETLIAAHEESVKAILADPNIGLRKLTVENWREYACYASRHFDQIKFDLGMLTKPPKPFTFPAGEVVHNDGNQLGEADPQTHQPQRFQPGYGSEDAIPV